MNAVFSQTQTDTAQALSDVSASSLLTLYCRAQESQTADPILHDEWAVEMTRQLSPRLLNAPSPQLRSLAKRKINPNLIIHIALRARQYDTYTRQFLNLHPEGTVVNLGCGMDTRFFRVDNGQAQFFDLDLPEVIRFKREFLAENERYRMLAASVFDPSWMEVVQQTGREPWLFLAEGLFMYLEAGRVKALVQSLRECFPGSELVCEVVNSRWLSKTWQPMIRRKMQRGGLGRQAEFLSGVADSREMETWAPGITLLDDWSYFDTNHPKLGWLRAFGKFELFRKTQWTVHYRLG